MSAAMHVCGLAMWGGEASRAPGASEGPSAAMLPRRVRGRASLLTRMLAEVVSGAANEAQVDLSTVPLIIGSAYGELATTSQLLEMMARDDGALSPARFQASVHNTAAGSISIAAGNRAFSTCLAAGRATCAAVLVEAFAWLSSRGGNVVVAVGDEPLPEFFAAGRAYAPLAMAMVLSSEPSRSTLAAIGPPLHDPAPVAVRTQPAEARALRPNPVAPWLEILAAVRAGQSEVVAFPGVSGAWRFEITPGRSGS